MKNTKKILVAIAVVSVIFLATFIIISFNNSNQNNLASLTISQQIAKALQKDKEWNDSFKQQIIENYKKEYINNYNKIKSGNLEDVGRVIQFEQLSPMIKTPPTDLFENIPYFQGKSINDYDFYTFTMSFFSTGFHGDINLKVNGPNEAAAFLGNEYLYIPQNIQPARYFSVFIAVKKGENIADYKITVDSQEPVSENEAVTKPFEINPVFSRAKTSGELKIGDSFTYKLNDNLTLYGTLMDITYEKTVFGSDSPKSPIVYKSSLARARILYAIEGNESNNLFFEKDSVLLMLNPYISSDYKVTGLGIEGLDYKSDIIIMPHYEKSYLGSFTTNGILELAAEAYVNQDIWEYGPDTVGFDKDVKIHFGDLYINLKAE